MAKREESLEKRLEELGRRLAKEKAEVEGAGDKKVEGRGQGYKLAIKLSSEFIAGILTGALLGYLFDTVLGTSPWGLVVFLLLGFCAAILNLLRASGLVATPQPEKREKDEEQ